MNEDERDNLLIELKTDTKWLKEGFSNHLKHHWAVTAIALGTALSAVIALIINLVT